MCELIFRVSAWRKNKLICVCMVFHFPSRSLHFPFTFLLQQTVCSNSWFVQVLDNNKKEENVMKHFLQRTAGSLLKFSTEFQKDQTPA